MKIYSSISVCILLLLLVLMIEAMDNEFPFCVGPDAPNEIFNFFVVPPVQDDEDSEQLVASVNIFRSVYKNFKKLDARKKSSCVKISSNENIQAITAQQSEE